MKENCKTLREYRCTPLVVGRVWEGRVFRFCILECGWIAFWKLPGRFCQALGALLGTFWRLFGPFERPLGGSRVLLEALGGSWGRLGGVLGALGAVLDASWELLGPSWRRPGGFLGAIEAILEASWELLGLAWRRLTGYVSHFGRLWRALGSVLAIY